MHYQRRRLLGAVGEAAPRFMHGVTPTERFWAKVNKDGPVPEYRPDLGPCWVWLAGQFTDGYAQFSVNGKDVGGHRFAYETVIGPIPAGLELDHLCRVRHCVNPTHLEPVTKRENIMRGEGVAAKGARKERCKWGHDLTDPVNLKPNNVGRRICRVCAKRWRHERYLRLGK